MLRRCPSGTQGAGLLRSRHPLTTPHALFDGAIRETVREGTPGASSMKVGMIGSGNVGRSLTKASTQAGHSVAISAASREDAEKLSREEGGTAAGSNAKAVEGADIVILAVPFDAVDGIVRELGSGLDGKVLIDVTNKFEPAQLDGPSNAERTQQMAPNARVVKAFNTVFAAKQSDPKVDGIQLDGFV